MRRTLIWYLAREFYCQVLWKEKKYGQNTVLHLVSKHFISCLKVFINLGGKLLPWGFLHRLPGKGKWGGSARGRLLHLSPGGCLSAPWCTALLGVWDLPAINPPDSEGPALQQIEMESLRAQHWWDRIWACKQGSGSVPKPTSCFGGSDCRA